MKPALLAIFALAAFPAPGCAQTPGAPAGAPLVVELYTSQSCSSCPPAEAYFKELSARPGLLSLEWHVDYWDSLQVAGAGRWKDPYSSKANTDRQVAYNKAILGKTGVYTPQAIVNGAAEAVGSDRAAVEQKIKSAQPATAVRVAASKGEGLTFTLTGAPADAEPELVTFHKSIADDVRGGENKGRQLSSANVVIAEQPLKLAAQLHVPAPKSGDGCALLVRAPRTGKILGAAVCPS